MRIQVCGAVVSVLSFSVAAAPVVETIHLTGEDHFTGMLPLLGYSHYWGSSLIAAAHIVETIHLAGAIHFTGTTLFAGMLPLLVGSFVEAVHF